MMQTRRFWLAAAALSLTISAATGAQAQSKKIRIGYWTSGFSVGFGAVLELGKFVEKQGLEPEWVRFADVNGPTKALVTNSIDVAFADLPLEPGPFTFRELTLDPCVLLVRADSPLARRHEPRHGRIPMPRRWKTPASAAACTTK